MSLGKPTIKLVFMDDDMRDYAINEATKALETSNSEKVSDQISNGASLMILVVCDDELTFKL